MSNGTVDIDYQMVGNINGETIEFLGEGQADFDTGIETVDIELSSSPEGWFAGVVPTICSGPSRVGLSQDGAPSLLDLGDGAYFTAPGRLRLGELFTADGNQIGKVAATGDYRRNGDVLEYRIKVRGRWDRIFELPAD